MWNAFSGQAHGVRLVDGWFEDKIQSGEEWRAGWRWVCLADGVGAGAAFFG